MLKLKKFLFSNKNMVGMGLAIITIILALFGVLKSYWMVVMLLSYILGYIATPKEKEIKFYHVKGENTDDYMGFVSKLQNRMQVSNKMPQEAKALMSTLAGNATELLQFIKDNDTVDEYSEDINSFKNIFDTYLPKLVNQYEKLPSSYANSVKTSQGKTAKDMLLEQLTLVNQKIIEIAHGMYENDLTALKVNGRFLKEKFENNNLFEIEKNT